MPKVSHPMDLFRQYFSYVWVLFGSCFSVCSSSEPAEIHETISPIASAHSLFSPSSASSFSTKSDRTWTYDVFLSFRGQDTRNNFVDHLHTALLHRGIRTFKDDQKLKWGETISLKLLKAIEESRCAVIIFSQNYATSSWCLEELAKIIECHERKGQRVLPVFFHVDPSDVRRQKGSFETAFQQHLVKYRDEVEKVTKWRDASTKAAHLLGCHVANTANGHESECIKQIVGDILEHMIPTHYEENLIGMESHVQALKSLLGTGSVDDTRMIGIFGMGGIGKTAIARAVFRKVSHKYEGSSFVKDVRETACDNNGLKSLQEKILKEILMERNVNVFNCDDGTEKIRKNLCNKKVLLVLDNVDNIKQLEFLAARLDWFGPGSRIIVTTRDEQLLANANYEYKPDLLARDQALELFSWYAFEKISVPNEYEGLASRVISYAGGLPLALKVLGSFFYGRQRSLWQSSISRLAKEQKIEIFETLKLSFDGLHASEKEIFLDIACFFYGEDSVCVTRILDSFGFDAGIGIIVLIERSLLTISSNRLHMHDLIRQMGRQIVCQNCSNSRLWKTREISDHDRLEAVEAIHSEDIHISDEAFRSMKKLRLLSTCKKFTSEEPNCLPDELRWVTWSHYPFNSLSLTTAEGKSKLVGFEMLGSLMKQLWMRQMLPYLKVMNLSESSKLKWSPDVSWAPNLEYLVLTCCQNLVGVHQSVAFHKRLVRLDLQGCGKLEIFPSSIRMKSLVILNLSGCKSLKRFPEITGYMKRLLTVDLSGGSGIKELPSSIRFLTGLGLLDLSCCCSLVRLPNTISELNHLKSMKLTNCNALNSSHSEIREDKSPWNLRVILFSIIVFVFIYLRREISLPITLW